MSVTGINATTPVRTLNFVSTYSTAVLYEKYSATRGIAAPTIPSTIPSITNGARTNPSVAPIYFIIPISSLRTEIPTETVLLIRKTEISRSTAIIAIEA